MKWRWGADALACYRRGFRDRHCRTNGAVPGKPVGTVCFGFAERRNGKVTCRTETMHFTGDRAEVRQQTVAHALKGLLTIVKAA